MVFSFYGYMMGAFAEIVNPLTDYNGIPFEINSDIDPRFRSTMFVDNETMMLGVPRIRQVRVKICKCPGAILIPSHAHFYFNFS